MFLEHDALPYADKIGPVPLLMIVEDEDTLAAVDLSLNAYQPGAGAEEDRFLPRRSLRRLCARPGRHARAASDWYVEHLTPKADQRCMTLRRRDPHQDQALPAR
jgi:hypothetical protein